jgi:hypothetical protein
VTNYVGKSYGKSKTKHEVIATHFSLCSINKRESFTAKIKILIADPDYEALQGCCFCF